MTIRPKNLFKAKILTQKFNASYKIDPKIYFPAKKVPSKMANLVFQFMGVTTLRYHNNTICEIFFQKKFMSRTIKTQKIFVSRTWKY